MSTQGSPKQCLISLSSRSRLEFNSCTGDLQVNRAHDPNRALLTLVEEKLGILPSPVSVKPKISITTDGGRRQLVYDQEKDKVKTVYCDPAKEILRQYYLSSPLQYNEEMLAHAAQVQGFTSTQSMKTLAAAIPVTYTTSNGFNRLRYDQISGQMESEHRSREWDSDTSCLSSGIGTDANSSDVAHDRHLCLEREAETARGGFSFTIAAAAPHRLQPEIDALLASLKPPSQPPSSKKPFSLKSKFRSAVRAVMLMERAKKKHEVKCGFLCIPRPGEPFSPEKCTQCRPYFAVIRKKKFMIYNTEAEYVESKGTSGTRANHLLTGGEFRRVEGIPRAFEAKFATATVTGRVMECNDSAATTSSGEEDCRAWVTFWIPLTDIESETAADAYTDETACNEWLTMLEQSAQISIPTGPAPQRATTSAAAAAPAIT